MFKMHKKDWKNIILRNKNNQEAMQSYTASYLLALSTNLLMQLCCMNFSFTSSNTPFTAHSPTGASISPGPGVSKWPGPGFPYYSSKAGAIEVQKRNSGRRGSSYTSNWKLLPSRIRIYNGFWNEHIFEI